MADDQLTRAVRRAAYLDAMAKGNRRISAPDIADFAEIARNPSLRAADAAAENVDIDVLALPPTPAEAMFYGALGDMALEAATGTEVNPVAAMTAGMIWLSATMGRNSGFSVGDGWHHLRLYGLHVGRSSLGGKGMALDLLKRVRNAIEKSHPGLSGHFHAGGLSSREGLAFLIHDGYRDGNDDIPPVADKRLLVLEPEFANIISQAKRDGNTLSSALRDAWDGSSIQPATKNARLWSTQPHIALYGCITPSELRAKMASNDLTNGFANRFLIVWAERIGKTPFPRRTPEVGVEKLAARFAEIILYGLAGYPDDQGEQLIALEEPARELYAECYRRFRDPHPSGELVTALLERRAPMLLRIAGLFAITDLTTLVKRHHVEAAAAWMDYYTQSVAFIFGPMADAAREAIRNRDADTLMGFFVGKDWVSRTAISNECFKKHLSAADLDAILNRLALTESIERRVVNSGPRKRTEYRLRSPQSPRDERRADPTGIERTPQSPQFPQVEHDPAPVVGVEFDI